MAHNSFKVNLLRLRQLLGNDDIIQIHEGHLTLNPRHCFVDAWVFERTVNRAEEMMREQSAIVGASGRSPLQQSEDDCILSLTDKAISIYRGHFLSCPTMKTGCGPYLCVSV